MKRPTGKHEVHDFPATMRNPGTPQQQKGHVVACTVASCTETLFIPAGGTPGPFGMPKVAVIKKATQKGWLVRKQGRSVTCPGCQGHLRPILKAETRPTVVVPLDPAVPVHVVPAGSTSAEVLADTVAAADPLARARLDAFLLADTMRRAAAIDSPTTPAAAAAPEQDEPPMDTTTTPALRRAINAQLHNVHAGEDGYLSDWTDAKVAKVLDCAPAAVAAIRADLFGPDTNDEQRRAAAARETELADIRQQLLEGKARVDQSMETLAAADRLYADALARLAKIEGKT